MGIFSMILTILGLSVFETVSSIDNAIINAEVLSTMQEKARKWFLLWGLLFAVFLVRGLLPWLIVWVTLDDIGPIGALTATFSNDPVIKETIEKSAPVLLIGGGVFLIFLFIHWLFVEKKNYALRIEHWFHKADLWFYSIASVLLAVIVWVALKKDSMMAFSAIVGSSAFFIASGFKHNAEESEKKLMHKKKMSDIHKILYLEVIDMTFSIDGVLGAFAFTLSIPLILLGNGLGALIVRQLTVRNIDNIKKYLYLKNGAMYSIFGLGVIMVLESFGAHLSSWMSPTITFAIIGYFFWRSWKEAKTTILPSAG